MSDTGRGTGPDFIEALARGLDVLRTFRPGTPTMTLSEIAGVTGLARPTVRRILITLESLGYVRGAGRGYALTPRVLDLGMAYVNSLNMWEIARPHMEKLVAQTGESTSMAQLDGSDIVYVARVAVPKIVTLSVTIGTRFPAAATSMGKVLLAALPPAAVTGNPLGRHRGTRRKRQRDRRRQRDRPCRRDVRRHPPRRPPAQTAPHGRRHKPRLEPDGHRPLDHRLTAASSSRTPLSHRARHSGMAQP
jgi:DNA-binding IclR family transcriptional regulator